MSEPISIENSTKRENRISFFEHRNKIIGNFTFKLKCLFYQN